MNFDTREQFKKALTRLIDIELAVEGIRNRIVIGPTNHATSAILR